MATEVERLMELTEKSLEQTAQAIASANRALDMVVADREKMAEMFAALAMADNFFTKYGFPVAAKAEVEAIRAVLAKIRTADQTGAQGK